MRLHVCKNVWDFFNNENVVSRILETSEASAVSAVCATAQHARILNVQCDNLSSMRMIVIRGTTVCTATKGIFVVNLV